MDRVVIVVALSGFLIRLGNLMNSEIFGIPTILPWGFRFLRTTDLSDVMVPRHPTQLYEGLSYLIIFLLIWWLYYKKQGKPARGLLFGIFLILVFGMRFLIEFIKEPQEGFEKSMILNMGQLLSIPLIITGVVLVILAFKKPVIPD